ncbi:MAG: YccF domain-containing protein [Clostridia bacterium]|nr:YccF domain-containing protein [Clostridia bacterium]
MSFIGNVIWLVFGGFISGLAWILNGILWCITIVGIPIGKQCFKFAKLSFSPFGKEVTYGGGAVSTLVNVIWIVVSGWEMAVGNFLMGVLFYITIVGIPFGKQFFKLAKLSLMPFGAKID